MSKPKPKRVRRRKPGDLGQLRAVLWGMLLEAETIAQDRSLDENTRLKAIAALATTAGAYLKATEQADLEQRLKALEDAVHWGLLPWNPADRVKAPQAKRYIGEVWTPEEAWAFLTAAQESRWYTLFLLALMTGMRQGELLGLQWPDVDWQGGCIWVRRNYTVAGGRRILHSTKTYRSTRPVDVAEDTLEALRQHREQQERERLEAGDAWAGTDWVFTTSVGTPIGPGNLRREFARLIAQAGVKRIRFHDLRDTHVSLLALAGVDAKVISERVGHANVSFTQQIYQHTFAPQRKQAALAVSELLGPKEGRPTA